MHYVAGSRWANRSPGGQFVGKLDRAMQPGGGLLSGLTLEGSQDKRNSLAEAQGREKEEAPGVLPDTLLEGGHLE